MLVYFLMVAYVFLIGIFAKQRVIAGASISKNNNYTSFTFAILIFALPVFLIGFRTKMGDTETYIYLYEHLSSEFPTIEENIFMSRGYGWDVYQYLLKNIFHLNANWFLMITALFQAGGLIKFFYAYSTDYPFSVTVFFLSAAFTEMMNGIRQFFAICLILYFCNWIFQKKIIRFILVVLIAFTIHNAVVVWLVAIFLIHGKPANLRMMIVGFLVLLAITFVDSFTNILADSISETAYAGYTEQFSSDDGSNFVHTIISAIPLIVAYTERKKIIESKDSITFVFINIAILNTMISLLANFTSGILMGRMTSCFSVFSFAFIPRLFRYTSSEANSKTLRTLWLLGEFAFFLYYMFYMKPEYSNVFF